MAVSSSQFLLLCVIGIVLLARPAHAFGAGNIGSTSKIEGENWRHGDLEDTLLTIVASKAMGGKKFGKLDVKRVYFGNWLRDYSQAVDVGTVKNVSAEAIRILLWVLGFMTFGYGSKEFEVTTERLGCYRPEEHIDNPKDYADNEDARQYDRRLRGPIDERRELSINEDTGLKNYIASEGMGIDTSAGLVRNLFGRCIDLGRKYARNKNKEDLYEALRLLGTGCHCLEDFSAHSNYVELALVEMGERDIFPHVGRRTGLTLREVRREVYPIVTGTFGGVDFLHSVCGEFDDKATQSEIQELEGTLNQAQAGAGNQSVLQELLNKIPSGVFGGQNQAGKVNELQQNAAQHQMQNTKISPRQPEEWVQYLEDTRKQIYPIIEWHDEVMQSISETIEKIPILPTILEQLQDQINMFVFSLLAPYIVPIIGQVKSELNTGSSEIIESSKHQQHIVFSDDRSSDPTHSMLSKDHFSNILNEPAGKVASQTVKWIVPQLIAAWDDERVDVKQTLDRIIYGTLHHPALREYGRNGASDGRRLMFGVVEKWWSGKSSSEKNELRRQLSRDGVEQGLNHKEGVTDHGHGSNKPLMNFNHAQPSGGSSYGGAAGAGVLGGIMGSITGAAGSAGFGGYGSSQQVGQSQYSQTQESYGGRQEQYSQRQDEGGWQSGGRTEQSQGYGNRYGDDRNQFGRGTEQQSYGGGFGGASGRQEEMPGGFGGDEDDNRRPGGYGGNTYQQRDEGRVSAAYGGGGYEQPDERRQSGRYGGDDDRRDENRFSGGYGGGRRDSNERRNSNERRESGGGYGRQSPSGSRRGSYGRRQEPEEENRYERRGSGQDRRSNRSRRSSEQRREQYNPGGYEQEQPEEQSYDNQYESRNEESEERRDEW